MITGNWMQSSVVYVYQLDEGLSALRTALKIYTYSDQMKTIKQIHKSENKFHHKPGVILLRFSTVFLYLHT
jgi:pterin-4a-carbinolamine dehydratase